jgi:tRNA(fMet)-specific endonuclease VapC
LILVDTDHATLLKYPDSERGRRFVNRLSAAPESEVIGIAIVTVEERMRGWLAVIAKEKTALRQVAGYRELAKLFEFYQEFEIIAFDEAVARQFDKLRSKGLRISTMDLKIVATALVNSPLLLSANQRAWSPARPSRRNWLDEATQ